ncbi:hypothetical protein [Parageobacillus thermoglucosidasius]|uniref:hypothetical protein n=1 Tax=Parageobacillus thermoglucosidasius TaxID=1426 RepID=UPI000E19B748|nr:hypothetical protein [Parageobacillus thermoglucosidasius]RDE19258.1 hypothetical protein DV714_19580 [Parageobacillus thermoglucosidasius]
MVATPKRLYKGTAGTTSSTAYTVPSGITTIVKNIVITNKTSNAATATITIAGTEIVYQNPIAANDTVILDLSLVMNATETITVQAGTANAINIYISGVEVS